MTEHFQDGNPNDNMAPLFCQEELNIDDKFRQFYSQSKGFGKFEIKKLLYGEPDYPFSGFHTVQGDSSEEELGYIINNILKPNFKECYIRDNSILGFPSYHIYIPEISDIYDIYNNNDLYLTFKALSLQSDVLKLKNLSNAKLRVICETSIMSSNFTRGSNIPLYAYHLYNAYLKQDKPDNDLLLATILLQIGEIELSIEQLEKFVLKIKDTSDRNASRYYNCILDFLKLKQQYRNVEKAKNSLHSLYDNDLIEEVFSDLSNEDKLLYYNWPSCFHCEVCKVKDSCQYPDAMSIVRRIQDNTVLTNQDDIISMINNLTGGSRKSIKE